MTQRAGKCLCGAVAATADLPDQFGACHCATCRRWGGGPLLAVHARSASFEGETHITCFNSSDWAERGFCKTCGTHLFYRIKQSGEYVLPLGLFDDVADLTFASQIFVDEKPGAYAFANDTGMMTGAEVFAQYAPPEGD